MFACTKKIKPSQANADCAPVCQQKQLNVAPVPLAAQEANPVTEVLDF